MAKNYKKSELNKYDQLCEMLSTNIAETKSPERVINNDNYVQYSKSCSRPKRSQVISPLKRNEFSDSFKTVNSEVSNASEISGLSCNSKKFRITAFDERLEMPKKKSSIDNYEEFETIMLKAMNSNYKSSINAFELDVSVNSNNDVSNNSAITQNSCVTRSSIEEL